MKATIPQLTVSYEPEGRLAEIAPEKTTLQRQDREQALAKTAFAIMSECGVTPTPDNYELFFTYASGDNAAVGRIIDGMIAARRSFTDAVLSDLRQRCLSTARADHAIDTASAGIAATLNAVLGQLEAAGRDAGDYGRALSRASGELGAEQSPADVRKFVDTLVAATQSMEARTMSLEKELQHSSQQVSALKAQLDDARKESLTDALTHIANRKAFDAEIAAALDEARETGEPVALLMCDIDHFKTFNDTWGHQTGDQVLRLVAKSLSENIKGRDMVARFGGEEFAVVLRRTSLENATRLAEQSRAFVEGKKLVKKSTSEILGTITISIGVACSDAGETTPASLIQKADGCLYRAKNRGRNRVVDTSDQAYPETDAA